MFSRHHRLLYPFTFLLLSTVALSQDLYYPITPSLINPTAISFDVLNPYQCPCDLNQGSCDNRCCCDTDCDSTSRDNWRSSGICIVNTKARSFCSLENNVFQIKFVGDRRNIQYSFFDNSTDAGVCVEVTPDPKEFRTSTLITSSQFSIDKADAIINRIRAAATAPTNPTSSARSYSFGYNIMLAIANTYMTIATPDAFGNCDFSHRLRFGVNEEKRTCKIQLTQSTCAATNSEISSPLKIAEQFVSNLASKSLSSSKVFLRGYKIESNKAISVLTSAPGAPSNSGTGTCTCSNVLVGLEYYLVVTSSRINSIQVVPTVTDVVYNCADTVSVYQTSFARFVPSVAQANVENVNEGNPGYTTQMPLRIGEISTQYTNAIQINNIFYNVDGINSSGNCLEDGSADSVDGKSVLFGTDAIYTCSKSIDSATTLQTFCDSTVSTGKWPNLGIFNNFVASTTYIGSFGNANPHYIKDFIKLSGTTLKAASPTYSNGICTMYTGATVNIYYANVGYQEDYQTYIASASVSFDGQTQVFATSSPQTVNFQLSIRFINMDQINSEFSNGTRPSFIPQLPDDILYPFFFPTEDDASALVISWFALFGGLLVAIGLL